MITGYNNISYEIRATYRQAALHILYVVVHSKKIINK